MRRSLCILAIVCSVGCYRHAVLEPSQLAEASAICVAPDPFSELDVHDTTQVKTKDGWERFCEVRPQPDGGEVRIRNYDEWLTLAAVVGIPAAVIGAFALLVANAMNNFTIGGFGG